MFSTPPLPIVKGLPLKVPPAQLKTALLVTGLVKLMIPLVKLTVSVDPGMPLGVQLRALNQSLEAEPFQA
jgi:hypothetical protein